MNLNNLKKCIKNDLEYKPIQLQRENWKEKKD